MNRVERSTEYGSVKIKLNEEARWNNLLLNSKVGTYMSGMSFQYSKTNERRELTTYIFTSRGKDIAGSHYSIRKTFGGIILIADILSGVVIKDNPDFELLSFIFEHFLSWAKSENAAFARINPWIPQVIDNVEVAGADIFSQSLNNYRFKSLTGGLNTYWLDLSMTEDQLLKRMHPGTRAKIRKALKTNLVSEINNEVQPELINKFWQLYSNLGSKKGFSRLSEDRFKLEVKSLLKNGLASLFVIRCDHKIVNIALASTFGNGMYYHGAINYDYKLIKGCPSPGHFAQWVIILYLKKLGLINYDMAFCPGPIPNKNHPQFDIWRFKYGFGGSYVKLSQVYGKVLKPIKGYIFWLLRYFLHKE